MRDEEQGFEEGLQLAFFQDRRATVSASVRMDRIASPAVRGVLRQRRLGMKYAL